MLAILHEDNHCIAVDKPAGLLTQGDETGDVSLVDLVREDLKRRYQKPGNVFVGLVHRLDRPVSGVVVFAKTSKGAARLSEQFRARLVEKRYWAVVEGEVHPAAAEWEDFLAADPAGDRVAVVGGGDSGGKLARLRVRVLKTERGLTLLELVPLTGRKHQLRVQLASRGWPIVGDVRYGARTRYRARGGGHRIALHARSLRFKHPTREGVIEVVSAAPADWPLRDDEKEPSG